MELSSASSGAQVLQALRNNASSSESVQLAISTSVLKESLETEELVLKLLQSVGKGNNLNVKA